MQPPHPDSQSTIRLVHFSDVHLTARPLGWRRGDWFSKRLAAWLNLRVLGRAHRFRQADRVLAALMEEVRRQPPDRVVFSGDATALGFESEVAQTARALGLAGADPLPGLAVPGNHDYCTLEAVRAGVFERYFAPWLVGERVDAEVYPFAQRVGHVWLVAVNSSVANTWPWDASGRVGQPQLVRLAQLLERLGPGPRILVTHYPVCLPSGKPERMTHGLRDLRDLVRVAAEGKICLWLHGHRHHAYHHAATALTPFPVICSGSATQTHKWSYGDYTIAGTTLRAVRRVFEPETNRFRAGTAFELELRAA